MWYFRPEELQRIDCFKYTKVSPEPSAVMFLIQVMNQKIVLTASILQKVYLLRVNIVFFKSEILSVSLLSGNCLRRFCLDMNKV